MASPLVSKGQALLRQLEPAVRPVAESRVHDAHFELGIAVETLDPSSFGSLLDQARRGEIESGQLPDASALREALPPEALLRIGRAMDLLEARGSQRAALLYGTRMIVADIATRTIEGEFLAHEGPAPLSVDAAVRVPTPEEERPTAFPGPPIAITAPPGVIELLEARDSHQ